MYIHSCSEGGDPEQAKQAKQAMRDMFGPQAVDQAIGQAITTCWMMLPEDKKNVATLEAEIRRIVERALASLKEDAGAFGIPADG
jgi:hypothetical protein